eukprot:194718_1
MDHNSDTSKALNRLIQTVNEHTKSMHNSHENPNAIDRENVLNILNDFHHFLQSDNDASFKMLTNKLIKCDSSKCFIAKRNYRNRSISSLNNNTILYPNGNKSD